MKPQIILKKGKMCIETTFKKKIEYRFDGPY